MNDEDIDEVEFEVRFELYYGESKDMLKGLLHGVGHVKDLTFGP